jgi:hypothetical protein
MSRNGDPVPALFSIFYQFTFALVQIFKALQQKLWKRIQAEGIARVYLLSIT